MASAAGIILATGGMTIANEFVQSKTTPDPNHPIASVVNWKVIPATVIAAGLFYGLEQANAKVAAALAFVAFATAFAFVHPTTGTSPLGTLMSLSGVAITNGYSGSEKPPYLIIQGLPYGN